MNLLERIHQWGRICPDRLAHVSRFGGRTYGELVQRAEALAAHLQRTLPDDRSPVVVVGHKEPEILIAFLACLQSGHPYAPVDTIVPPQRLERIVATAGARLTLTPETIEKGSGSISVMEPDPFFMPRPDDPFYIMFTSGSTGEPKGVVITHGCVTSFVDWMIAEQSFAERDEVFLNVVPYSFDVSVMDTYLALLTGNTVWAVSREEVANPRQLYSWLASSGTTTWVSTPSFASMCLVERTFRAEMLPRLRRFLFCGETLAPEVATQLLERFPGAAIWNTYGPTEATVAVTSVRIDADLVRQYAPLPIGHPMIGGRIAVVDEAGAPVPDGERGQIIIAGTSVSPGYLGRPDLTERAFFTFEGLRAYRTGDWGRYRDGLLFFEGRMDNQIKLHGYRIELADVEANLLALPAVRDAAVVPIQKNGAADALAAFVILRERGSGSDFQLSTALRQQLAERLPPYMLPRKFCFLESFPMNTNGKADRRRLAESLRQAF